jgi:hypothetical protein
MEPLINHENLPVPVAIAAPRAVDGTGSALRRAFPAPGAVPAEMLRLLRELDRRLNRSGG